MDKRASVLMVSLWILAILVIFALGLGRRASINLRLATYQRDKLSAYLLAKAGINQAIALLESAKGKSYDTLDQCGIDLNGKSAQEVFSQAWDDGNRGFNIGYTDSNDEFIYGLQDEESRININLATEKQLESLFNLKDIQDAAGIAAAVLDWINPSSTNEYAKKEKFKIAEELLPVLVYFYQQQGMAKNDAQEKAQETFAKIEGLITVNGEGKMNINTAPEEILMALALSVPGSDLIVASELTSDIIAARKAVAFQEPITTPSFSDALKEEPVFNELKNYLKTKSGFFRIESNGYVKNIGKKVISIYSSANGIVFWHEN